MKYIKENLDVVSTIAQVAVVAGYLFGVMETEIAVTLIGAISGGSMAVIRGQLKKLGTLGEKL